MGVIKGVAAPRGAWVVPVLGAVAAVAAIAICWVLAVASGHCDVEIYGRVTRVSVPPISPTANRPPERWVWSSMMGAAVRTRMNNIE